MLTLHDLDVWWHCHCDFTMASFLRRGRFGISQCKILKDQRAFNREQSPIEPDSYEKELLAI
jgi:hypothetical protein